MSSDKKKFEMDRRSLLKNILVGTGMASAAPLDMFISNMMINFLQSGTAHAAGVEAAFQDFKFINLCLGGGPSRFYWDLPINPNGESFVENGLVKGKFNISGNDVTSVYATSDVGNFKLPYVWESNIPTADGGVTSMKNLADSMMMIRGVDLRLDSHPLNRPLQIMPVAGGLSLTGLVADKAVTPIPAISRDSANYYRGEKGVPLVPMQGTNPLTNAISPFTPLGSMISLNNGEVEKSIDQALQRMAALSGDKNKFLPSTFAARFSAKKMMMKSFGNLQTSYTSLVVKYTNLMKRSFAASGDLSLIGVDDHAIPSLGTGLYRVEEFENHTGSDIRNLTDGNTYVGGLAESMAICEFMLTQGLSSSINVECSGIAQTFYESTKNTLNNAIRSNIRTTYAFDAHFLGSHTALIVFSRFYRALSACLYELRSQLRAKQIGNGENLFDRTVMTITSEFNRTPAMDGTSTGHGWQGSNYTILSGMFDQLHVVGNIKTNGTLGTWGQAGGLDELNGREAIIGNAASTVASLVEVHSPAPNDLSLVYKEKGKARPALKAPKNVA